MGSNHDGVFGFAPAGVMSELGGLWRPSASQPPLDRLTLCFARSDAVRQDDVGVTSSPATFIFADIAGFTALTEAHGDLEAAELVVDFACGPRGASIRPARLVKTIGDAVMLRIASPAEAVRLGLRIIEGFMWDPAPVVRVGLHHGHAVERDGDYIGATVNVAARVPLRRGSASLRCERSLRACGV